MREIKFRAWHTFAKIMYSAKELEEWQETLCPNGKGFITVNKDDAGFRSTQCHKHLLPMQYTGLKDKSGREIYEGDVIETVAELMTNFGETPTGKYQTTHLAIEYDSTKAQFKERDLETNCLKPLGLSQDIIDRYSEVIGNIYENPELLKEEQ